MGTTKVSDVMLTDLRALAPRASVGTALTALLGWGVSSAAVIDEAGRPVGLLSLADILGNGRGATVQDRMESPAVTISDDAAVMVAARLAIETGLDRLPVVDRGGHLVGMVGALDLLRYALRALEARQAA